jgi:hypothetical protein
VEIKIIKRKNNKCKNCGEKGHYIKECLNNRMNMDNDNKNGNPDQKDTKGKKLYIGDDYVTIKNKIYDENVKNQRI